MMQRKIDQTTSLLHDPVRLKALLLATKRGMVNEVCEEFGISPAAYYRIIDKVVAAVATAAEHARAVSDSTRKLKAEVLLQRLRALVLAHPTWGCDRLAAEMSIESPISGPTVQKLLNQEGLKGRNDRIHYLLNAAQSGITGNLNAEQLEAISEVDPALVDTLRDREAAVLDVVELCLPIARQHGKHNYLRLYVTLDGYFTFGEIDWDAHGPLHHELSRSMISSRLASLTGEAGLKKFRVYQHNATPKSERRTFIFHPACIRPTPAAQAAIRHGMTLQVGKEIERRLFAIVPQECQSSRHELQSALRKILLEYNTTAGSPDGLYQGKSPARMIGLSDAQAQEFLGRPR